MELAELALLDHLRDHLPGKLAELRIRYGVDDDPLSAVEVDSVTPFLPDVREWLTGDPRAVAVGDYPAVAVSGLDSAIRPVELDEYRVTYRLRAFGYVRGQAYDLVHAQRNRLMLGIRELTLATPGLLALGGRASLVRERMTESYSDVVPDGAGRSLAAAYTELYLAVNERLDLGPATGTPDPVRDIGVGTEADPTTINVRVAPAHPALD